METIVMHPNVQFYFLTASEMRNLDIKCKCQRSAIGQCKDMTLTAQHGAEEGCWFCQQLKLGNIEICYASIDAEHIRIKGCYIKQDCCDHAMKKRLLLSPLD